MALTVSRAFGDDREQELNETRMSPAQEIPPAVRNGFNRG